MGISSVSLWSDIMRICIQGSFRQPFTLSLPTGLVLNRFSAALVTQVLQTHRIVISQKQAAAFLRTLKAYRTSHKDWVFVEVDSASGEHISITL